MAVHVAKACPTMINALCVIDVVEGKKQNIIFSYRKRKTIKFRLGSALESLSSMQCFLSSRPKQFSSPQKAIEYMVRSGQVRNVESARVSIIGQIQPIVGKSSTEENSSTIAVVSHVCESVREEDEEEGETEQNQEKSIKHEEEPTTNNYTWRIDLSKTEPFWQGWFSGNIRCSFLRLSLTCLTSLFHQVYQSYSYHVNVQNYFY